MDSRICPAREITHEEWQELRELYIQAFVAMSENVSIEDLALMGNNSKKFWAAVFDRDQPQSSAKNYIFNISKENEKIISYGLYTYINDERYLYIHHFVVHPGYQRQGLGKRLMSMIQALHGDAKTIGLLTRTYNIQAQNFYKRLGFSESLQVPAAICEYYSPDRVYMEQQLKAFN